MLICKIEDDALQSLRNLKEDRMILCERNLSDTEAIIIGRTKTCRR